jgi:hypothetical protein
VHVALHIDEVIAWDIRVQRENKFLRPEDPVEEPAMIR